MKMIRLTRARVRWLLFFGAVAFNAWMWYSFQAAGLPADTFEQDDRIRVSDTDGFISFTPVRARNKVVLFYPGGLVEPEAYAPLCRQVALHGYTTVIVKMPWRMANLGYTIPRDNGMLADTSRQYVLMGHSKGAAMASRFVYEYPGLVDQLILIGTTHPKELDLSDAGIPVMKVYATHDGVADMPSVEANKWLLPEHTRYVKIEGGNHAQFGYYSDYQLGDDRATITREEQQWQVVQAVLAFIDDEE